MTPDIALPGGTPEAPDPSRPSGHGCGASGPFRVLAAEDHPTNRLVLKSILALAGIGVVIVDDGVAAVDAYGEAPWDLVLMDIQMPRMDGVNATRAIRRHESEHDRRRTPILAVTANVMDEQIREYLEAGIDAVVAKPIDVDALLQKIAAYRPA